MIGASLSSIFIKIEIIRIIGKKITIPVIQANISKILFIILHQLSRGVFFISITGILFIRDSVVFVFVISNEFVIYLYLIQNILDSSHSFNRSFFEKSLSIYSISSHFFDLKIFLVFFIFHRYSIHFSFMSFSFIYHII
jgi:hypothetical protein